MTGRRFAALLVRALGVVAGTVLMTCLMLPLSTQQASACDVSIGYRPSLNLNKPGLGLATKPCSTGTSLAGAIAFKRGAATAGASSPDQALTDYLHATSIAAGSPQARGHGEHDANRTP
jgi:hypothetical protein